MNITVISVLDFAFRDISAITHPISTPMAVERSSSPAERIIKAITPNTLNPTVIAQTIMAGTSTERK